MGLPRTRSDVRLIGTLEIRNHGSRRSGSDAPVPVKRIGHIEIGGSLHPAQAERAMQKLMRVVDLCGDSRDVVQAPKTHIPA